jgi:hypothetical protein
MSGVSPSAASPLGVLVELKQTGDGLRRWTELRRLWALKAAAGSDDDVEGLLGVLEDALQEAQSHARSLAAFFEKHAQAINDAVSAHPHLHLDEGQRKRLNVLGPDYAGTAVSELSAFLELSAGAGSLRERIVALATDEPSSDEGVTCGDMLVELLVDDVSCILGDPFACELVVIDMKVLDEMGC